MFEHQTEDTTMTDLSIRRYAETDREAVSRLYTDGLLAGQIASNDTGADIDNIEEAYFSEETSHFWIADLESQVLGMIGVARDEEHTAEIRRLRVDNQFQATPIAAKLVETALEHCQKHGYLKVVFDTRIDPESGANAVVSLFDRFGFQHTRTKAVAGKALLEFYLDLYRQPKNEKDDVGQA